MECGKSAVPESERSRWTRRSRLCLHVGRDETPRSNFNLTRLAPKVVFYFASTPTRGKSRPKALRRRSGKSRSGCWEKCKRGPSAGLSSTSLNFCVSPGEHSRRRTLRGWTVNEEANDADGGDRRDGRRTGRDDWGDRAWKQREGGRPRAAKGEREPTPAGAATRPFRTVRRFRQVKRLVASVAVARRAVCLLLGTALCLPPPKDLALEAATTDYFFAAYRLCRLRLQFYSLLLTLNPTWATSATSFAALTPTRVRIQTRDRPFTIGKNM